MGRGSSKIGGGSGGGDKDQMDYAKFNGWTKYAKKVDYVDSNGKHHIIDTGRANGGTMNVSYNPMVQQYMSMSISQLQSRQQSLKSISNANYQMFTRAAASRSGSMVNAFANADAELAVIKQVLWIKKNKR